MFSCLCKGLSNDDVEGARGTVFQDIWPGVRFKPGDFVQENAGGGAAVERLNGSSIVHA